MAEDAMNHAITLGKLDDRPSVTHDLRIHGYLTGVDHHDPLCVYGSDAPKIIALANEFPDLARQLHPDLPYIAAEVIWAAREEMACTVEDVLARRTRALFLNARVAIKMAPEVARLLARERRENQAWQQTEITTFKALAAQYMLR
jgi:glycerol-3-phosphate dehydrogenase